MLAHHAWCNIAMLLSPAAGVHATFLKQCVSAIDSLTLLADALKAAKPGLLQLLKGAGLSKEVEGYFSRTVDAAADLKEAIYLGAAKQLLPVRCSMVTPPQCRHTQSKRALYYAHCRRSHLHSLRTSPAGLLARTRDKGVCWYSLRRHWPHGSFKRVAADCFVCRVWLM